jgi:hypothetical protein
MLETARTKSIALPVAKLDATSLQLLERILEQNGFKWHRRGGTDACTGNIHVTLGRTNGGAPVTLQVRYLDKYKRGVWSSTGSVFSKSVATVASFTVPRDLRTMLCFVNFTSLTHYDWDGKPVLRP